MGYNVHITRRQYWFDEEGPTITRQEWLDYVAQDPQMQADGTAGDAWWRPDADTQVGLWHQDNRVETKNPGQDTLRKMHQIAQALDARVLGDENEAYGADGQMLAAPVDLPPLPAAPRVAAAASAAATSAPTPRFRLGTAAKILVSVLVWLVCLPGLFFHLFFGLAAPVNLLDVLLEGPRPTAADTLVLAGMSASVLSWGILAAMNIGWIRNQPLHWIWPVLGTTLAVAWQVPLGFTPSLFVAPGIVLACYLCVWHLWNRQRRGDRASPLPPAP